MNTIDLEIYGFDSASSKVFNFLLHNVGKVTAKFISENLGIPPKAVYHSLKQLEKEEIIESTELDYPKLFSIRNPAHALSQLVEAQVANYEEKIRFIRTELDKTKSTYLNQFFEGSCKRQISFYHFTSESIEAKEFVLDQIRNAKIEILISLLPKQLLYSIPDFMKTLNKVSNNGIWVGIYLLENDFDVVAKLDDKILAFMVDSPLQNYCSVDNKIFIEGHILVDRKRLISLTYDPQGKDWILSSFIDFNTVEMLKGTLRSQSLKDARELFNSKNQEYQMIEALRNEDLSKQELMSLLKISGHQLNLLLEKLEEKSLIVIEKVTKGKGRPQERVFLSK